MKELIEYRKKMIERFLEATNQFCSACRAVKDPFEKMEGDWSLHQIAWHTRDVEKLIYGARILQTLNKDNPMFKNFDADAWMAAHYNKDESLDVILNELTADVDAICRTLSELPQEAWSRESRHETIGDGLTLQFWVERSLAHMEEHLVSVTPKRTAE